MPATHLSRRHLLQLGSAASAAALLPLAPRAEALSLGGITPSTVLGSTEAFAEALLHAFAFQQQMMDAYATGDTIRLTQSYSDAALGATAFTYDNAVAIHAYLARGLEDDVQRAAVLGYGLLYAQQTNFPVSDGRLAQGYFVNQPSAQGAYISPAAYPYYFYSSAVGDQAWAGMALAQLYHRTGIGDFLTGALALANWIVTNTYDTQGPGGYRFGTVIDQYNQSQPSTNGKSTEHNIDTYAFFTMLSRLTGNGAAANGMRWNALAEHAAAFVAAMYDPAGPYYYTGTLGNQVTINTTPIPEDCQTWSFLALLHAANQGTIDWALANLETTDTAAAPRTSLTGSERVHGLVFSTASLTDPTEPQADPNAVWLEGTAHTAAALAARVLARTEGLGGMLRDLSSAVALLEQCAVAQRTLGAGQTVAGKPIPQGLGLVASTSVMDTGFYYTYGPSLHIGATGWFLLAGLAANPFQLGYRVVS